MGTDQGDKSVPSDFGERSAGQKRQCRSEHGAHRPAGAREMEAMASGLPVIASPAGGVADHLRHEENGLAYPAGDVTGMAHAIVRHCMNRTLRDALARGARRTAEGLDWEVELDRLDASYHEVCARHAGRARFRVGPKPSAAPLTAPGR
jgi:glycosyltransferase involved in cell wall biosynthesis